MGEMAAPLPPVAANPAHANGFGTIRLAAALAVIVSHGFVLTGVADPLAHATGGQATLGDLAVSAFFVISGFLIPASFDRSSLGAFAAKRARRIMPGLVVAVLVAACIIGPLATRLPLGQYAAHPGTFAFLGNALFLPVGYDLPGLFEGQPVRAANGSLWSLKFELACYAAVPLLLAWRRGRKAAVIAAWLASFVAARVVDTDAGGLAFYLGQGAQLFRFFGAGMVFYLFSGTIALRPAWGWAATGLFGLAAFTPAFMEAAALAGSYALMVLATRAPRGFGAATARGDISYGVYVYAFPIQQLLVAAGLGIAANIALAMPLAMLAGLLSWVWVERRFLKAGTALPPQPTTTSPAGR